MSSTQLLLGSVQSFGVASALCNALCCSLATSLQGIIKYTEWWEGWDILFYSLSNICWEKSKQHKCILIIVWRLRLNACYCACEASRVHLLHTDIALQVQHSPVSTPNNEDIFPLYPSSVLKWIVLCSQSTVQLESWVFGSYLMLHSQWTMVLPKDVYRSTQEFRNR